MSQIICSFRNFLLSNSFDVDEFEDEDASESQINGQRVFEWIQRIKCADWIVESSQNRIEPDIEVLSRIRQES